jgi:predicted RNA-binding protein YlqC (UPF0109 family)
MREENQYTKLLQEAMRFLKTNPDKVNVVRIELGRESQVIKTIRLRTEDEKEVADGTFPV